MAAEVKLHLISGGLPYVRCQISVHADRFAVDVCLPGLKMMSRRKFSTVLLFYFHIGMLVGNNIAYRMKMCGLLLFCHRKRMAADMLTESV
jgi:hypothetical protein